MISISTDENNLALRNAERRCLHIHCRIHIVDILLIQLLTQLLQGFLAAVNMK